MSRLAAFVIACAVLLHVTRARADLDPPGSDVSPAMVFEGLERFPEHRFFVMNGSKPIPVRPHEPIVLYKRWPTLALYALASPTPSLDTISINETLAGDQAKLLSRASIVGFVWLKEPGSPITHLLNVYEVKAIEGQHIALEPTRVEYYEVSKEERGKEPWEWYIRAHAGPELPTPRPIRPPPRWPFGAAALAMVLLTVGLMWRARS